MMSTSLQLSNNTTALASQGSLASVVIDENEGSANGNNGVLSGGVSQADTSTNSFKRLQDDLESLGLKIKQHEDNIKSLKAQKNMLDDSILDKEVILGKYHSSASPSAEDKSFSNGGEEETTEQILKHDKSAAGILCQLKTCHGTQAPILDLSQDVIGIVATLGKVDDENLSRPYVGDFVADDPQRRLDLIKPRLPNGQRPPGFLDFAVNMVNIDTTHIFCLTASGYGLRETLFYHLFSRTQVYSTRVDMLRALPFISGGAISLDGGMIRGPGIYSLGNREDVDVRFPVPSASGASGLPANYHEMENQMEDLKWRREKLLEDLRRERQTMDQAKLSFERKKQEFVVFLAQSSSYVTQINNAMGLERLSQFTDKSFADIWANSFTGTLTTLPDAALSGIRPQSKHSRLRRTSQVALNKGPGPAEAKGCRGGARQRCAHCASEKTPQWRAGPLGPKTLCNACGMQYRSGRLVPEYRPAASPMFLLTQHSNSHRKSALSGSRPQNKPSRPQNKRPRLLGTSQAVPRRIHSPASKGSGPAEAEGGGGGARQQCAHCASEKTPQWRAGPLGPKTLCNACGVRYKSGQLLLEYRPAASPTVLLTQHSNSHSKPALSGSRLRNKRLRLPGTSPAAPGEGAGPTEAKGGGGGARRQCTHCESEKTPQWREGPLGPKTLCNACGVRYKTRRLVPEYRPAASPTFVSTQHSNSHRKVMELRRQKEASNSSHHQGGGGGGGQSYCQPHGLEVG
ncbi:uncharacterized protein LOC115690485 isoform X2 [Syzygium oleosum]|uniref:uncharacterized protein LOC115690485 isoform X2 n=1 Tax=Syzygium oleosum TaxID=219896 RepID=UPI0024BA4EA6|nr:uncharacterized protein LOC115690485 isoform X2 [Syzygium oleosum]